MYQSISPEDAVKIIKSNDRVFIQMGSAAPQTLIKAMTARHEELRNVEVCHLHTEGAAPYANPLLREKVFMSILFLLEPTSDTPWKREMDLIHPFFLVNSHCFLRIEC